MVSQQYILVDCCDASKIGTGGMPPIISHPNDQNCRRPMQLESRDCRLKVRHVLVLPDMLV